MFFALSNFDISPKMAAYESSRANSLIHYSSKKSFSDLFPLTDQLREPIQRQHYNCQIDKSTDIGKGISGLSSAPTETAHSTPAAGWG